MRVTIVSERADNNNYHLPRCYHFICENLVLCRKGESKSFNSPFASHGLLPVITHLVLVVISLVTEGDLLFTFFLQYLSVGVVLYGHHRGSRLDLLQTVPKPHQSRSSAAAAISREINAGILTCGRCSLGSLILCREKEFSFGFPACSVICYRCFSTFSSSSTCVQVGNCSSSSLTFFR